MKTHYAAQARTFIHLAAEGLLAAGLALGIGSQVANADEQEVLPRPQLLSVGFAAGDSPKYIDAILSFIDNTDGETNNEYIARWNNPDLIYVSSLMGPAFPGSGGPWHEGRIDGIVPGREYRFWVKAWKLDLPYPELYRVSPRSNEVVLRMPLRIWPFPVRKPELVRTVQYLLRHHGAEIEVDGVYGQQTKSAILEFKGGGGRN